MEEGLGLISFLLSPESVHACSYLFRRGADLKHPSPSPIPMRADRLELQDDLVQPLWVTAECCCTRKNYSKPYWEKVGEGLGDERWVTQTSV